MIFLTRVLLTYSEAFTIYYLKMEQKDSKNQKYDPIKKCVVPNCDANSVSPLEKFDYFAKYGCEIFYEWIKIIGLPNLGRGVVIFLFWSK